MTTDTKPSRSRAECSGGDLAAQLRGRYVTSVGRLASMSREQFTELAESFGARPTAGVARGVSIVVLGEGEWPVTKSGFPIDALRKLRVGNRHGGWGTRIFTERQFLDALGLYDYRDRVAGRYSLSTLSELLGIPPARIRTWVVAGLIAPVEVDHGVWYFDFRQATAAKTILDLLARPDVTLGRLRRSFERLHAWLPDVAAALHQVALLERDGELLVRLRTGELVAPDGQLRFEFGNAPLSSAAAPSVLPADSAPHGTLRLVHPPQSAADWAEQGAEQEQAGYAAEAVESYRQALLMGGPDADMSFSLANVLQAQGKLDQAAERYLQVVEMRPDFVDAWNNLGVCFVELDQRESACDAFRQALRIDPADARVLWNLADTLDELGRPAEATPHWRAYLGTDQTSERAAYAKRKLAAG